ncbi:MAG TPA: hypothetical protein VLC52_16650 [Anaerolineae bacterium]|nr:hypothetical protein [Anaerolineae bacterium]
MQVQILAPALALALLAAFVLDRLLQRGRDHWVGEHRLRAILWAAKLPPARPALRLHGGLAAYPATGQQPVPHGRRGN